MRYPEDFINKLICGNALKVLKRIPSESVNCCVCSPPYWSLRDYGLNPVIWDGNKNCKHIWKKKITKRPNASGGKTEWAKEKLAIKGVNNYQEFVDYHKRETKSDFCKLCGAWKGSLGLEPTFELYIKHLCDIFDEVKRVLRKDGTCWVNIGDSYSSSGDSTQSTHTQFGRLDRNIATKGHKANLPTKSLCDIPYRFSIEMINRGWIKRNTLIWWKPNCMPSSAKDRFTIDFEYLFFFTKNNKTLFWTNEKTLEYADKKPLGTKGIEGKDWEWRKCPTCNGEGKIDNKICLKCKGLRKVKYSFWKGHDYWFEQQFEKMADITLNDKRAGNDCRGKGRKDYKKEGISGGIEVRQRIFNNLNPNGRNKRCVWIISTQPFSEAHFAVYPEGLIEIPIKAGCPEFVCKKCGKARVKIYKEGNLVSSSPDIPMAIKPRSFAQNKLIKQNLPKDPYGSLPKREKEFIGYTDCGCRDPEYEGGIVLDPFMGAGTTALAALKQRKRFIGIEIKQEYIKMAEKRNSRVQQELI